MSQPTAISCFAINVTYPPSTTYYIESANCNGTTTPRQPVLATVVTTPAITAIVPASGCVGTNVVLSATANNSGILTWFNVADGGASSPSYATVSNIQSNTSRYVSAYNSYTEVVSPYSTTTCTSARSAVLATAMAVPTVGSVTPATLCGLTTATVSATSASGTLKWYDALTNGNLLATATSYTTPQMAASATYYVTSIGSNGCAATPRTSVAVTFTGPTVGTIADVNAQTATACSFVGSSLSGQTSFVWQRSFDGGSNWTDVSASLDAGVTYSGFSGTTETSTTLSLSTSLKIYSGAKYRIKLTQSAGCVNYSNAATLTVADVFGSCNGSEVDGASILVTRTGSQTWWTVSGHNIQYSRSLYDTDPVLGSLQTGYTVQGGGAVGDPAILTLDLGSARYLNKVYLRGFSWTATAPYTFVQHWDGGRIDVSLDNVNWTNAVPTISGTGTKSASLYVSYSFSAVNARYIRAYTETNSGSNGLSTFRVFAAPSGTPPYISNALPSTVSVANGTTFVATATATATGGTTISTYQWSKSTDNITFNNLTNGGTISGATTNTLTITGFLTGNTGYYKLTATQSNGCTVSTTINATWNSTPYYTTTAGYGTLQNTTSWTSSSGGTGGTAPTDFNSDKFFILANSGGNAYTPASTWTVGGTLQLNTNKLTLGNYDTTIGAINDASVTAYVKTNGTGRLIQSVINVPLLFPIGNSTYNPVTIINRTGTADNFSVKVTDGVLTGGSTGSAMSNVVNRTWSINKTTANSSPGVDLTFTWQAGDVTGTLSTADMKLFAWSGSAWVEQNSGAITRTATSIAYSGYAGTLSNTLFMVGNPMPSITSFTPTSASAGTTITINGTGFTNASAVSFGGTAATSYTVVSSTQITAVVASGTSGSVSVTAPGGTANLAGFTYLASPTITNFTPAEASTGQTVTIVGTNFVNISSVSFGNVSASSFTVVSSTEISAVVGLGATGSVSVSNGSTATKGGFIFVKPVPTITMADITKNVGDPSFNLTAPPSNSLGAFTYISSDPAVATISGSTVTITGVGSATLTANQAATVDYVEGSTTCTLLVKTNPVIYFANLNRVVGDGTAALTASTPSSGALTFTSGTPGVASISGSTLSVVTPGVSVITISQAANGIYNANSITGIITVGASDKTDPTLGPLANISKLVGDAAFILTQPTSNSAGAFTYYSSNSSVATVSGSTVTVVSAGITIITAVQAASGNYRASSVSAVMTVGTVGLTNPTITGFPDLSKYNTDAPFTLATPSSNSSQSFVYFSSNPLVSTVSGNTLTIMGLGSCILTAAQPAGGTYNAGSIACTLTVTHQPPVISYNSPQIYTVGSAISTLSPSSTGGAIVSYSISDDLPLGLTIDSSTGAITGTPAMVIPAATYVVTATNTFGSTTANISIEVRDAAPSGLSYATPNVFTIGETITKLVPTVSGGNVVSYAISPTLPDGMAFNIATGEISGTPGSALLKTTFTVTATNTGGSTSATLEMTVTDIAPSTLSYSSPKTLTKNTAITPLTPSFEGGAITGYSVSPALPAGLTLNSGTGIITGAPTSAMHPASTYRVTGTNSGGSVNFDIQLSVNDAAPTNLSYTTPNVFYKRIAITPLSPTSEGSAVENYYVEPALPDGLTIDVATGIISGTPTTITASATYVVTAENYLGSTTSNVVIEVRNTPATDITWTGALSTDWNEGGNWSVLRVPYDVDNVTIPAGTKFSPHVTLTGAAPAECNNITINTGAVLTVDATKALTVHNNLVNYAGEDGLVVKSNYLGDSGSGWTNNSGSLIVLGSLTGNGTVERAVNSDRWYLLSPPANEKVVDFIARNKNIPYWQTNIGDLKTPADPYAMRLYSTIDDNWASYFSDINLGIGGSYQDRMLGYGTGYLVRSVETGTPQPPAKLVFKGMLNSGTKSVKMDKQLLKSWNCIGNPYTSSICLNDPANATNNFLSINVDADANSKAIDKNFAALYFWNPEKTIYGKKGVYYEIINQESAAAYAQVGQGFFVRGNFQDAKVDFTPAMQVHQPEEYLKAAAVPRPTIQLIASNLVTATYTTVKFIPGMSKGLDVGYDAGIFKADPDFSLYTKLVDDNGVEFQLQCLPTNQYDKLVIPVGIDSKTGGEIVFSIETTSLEPGCKVILEDRSTNTFTDLSNNIYKANIEANTAGTGRFYLHTSDLVSGLADQVQPEKLTAYAVRNVEIRIIGEVGNGAMATLYNSLGQVVLTKKLGAGNLNVIGLPNLSSGVYMLNVNDKGKVQTIKVMVRK